MDINEKGSGKEKKMISLIAGGTIIYCVYEMIKGETKDILNMVDEECKEEEKLKDEWNELKKRYFNRIPT